MDATLPPYRPEESGTYALHRDEAIDALVVTHPVTAGMLVDLGWFPTRKKARERLAVLARRKRLFLVGFVPGKAGPVEKVYCRWQPKGDQLLHEIQLTEVCLRLSPARILRGPAIHDLTIRPDAEVLIDEHLFYLELDRGTMRIGQIEERLALYEGCRHVALWVCPKQTRLDEVRKCAKAVRCDALFTTIAEALADPHGEIWQDFQGSRLALPWKDRPDNLDEGPTRTESAPDTPAA